MGRGVKDGYKSGARRRRKNNGDDEDEDGEDEEYVAEEEEEEDDSSYNSDAPTEESFEVREASNSSGSSADEDDARIVKLKAKGGCSSRRRRPRAPDYEEMDADEDYEDEEEFSLDAKDDEEEDWEDDLLVSGPRSGSARRRGALKRGGRKKQPNASKEQVNRRSRKPVAASARRKRRRAIASSDADDEDFVVKGGAAVQIRKKDTKRAKRRKSKSARKKRSFADSDSFDSDYLTSDDDFFEEQDALHSPRKKNMANPGSRKTRSRVDAETSDSEFLLSDEDENGKDVEKQLSSSRKRSSLESDSTDVDDDSDKNEIRDLEIEGPPTLRRSETVCIENKGKEKEGDDLGKQLCGICLSEEQKGTVQGILNCCSHYFCFACIMEWSKVESRCPLCKRRFSTITKTSRSDPGLEIRRPVIRVQMRDQVYQPSEEELRVLLDPYENVVCMECHQGGDDSLMLLCDICDSSAHTYCVGLGREVPDGNWYCECCRLAGEGSSHSQPVETQPASNNHVSNFVIEENGSRSLRNNTRFQRSVMIRGQSSSQGFDLNVSPRSFTLDDSANVSVTATQALGPGASTLSGRRAIQQRIRLLLSNNRARPIYYGSSRTDNNLHATAVASEMERNGDTSLYFSGRLSSMNNATTNDQRQGNMRNSSNFSSNLVPCASSERRKFRNVKGAKKQVHSIVKNYLKKLPREPPIERSALKKIARHATHTILAACGMKHRRSMVSSIIQPPDGCSHDLDGGPVNFFTHCCPSCFTNYLKNAMKMFVE
ncbi:Methyl-CpG-binding domain-containing protein 9 [Apostasia shenzhenica]|uniref:Methyl-CpG-binding domain-containing protein 9 n=1 Tax=Apostasia shenzhenica TaxID=1088818 RepID=A0A2H9ZYQ4_9ASPA|nr:Methyl-CpG-binding domain-containing protein 9 [Apostasia shenzhenica]